MNPPNQITFTLKQHTPLIHFQHEQDGATLRATELKPKLDKFIITHFGNGDYDAGLRVVRERKWMIGKQEESNALNYQIVIESTIISRQNLEIINQMTGLLSLDNITVKVLTFNKHILSTISDLIKSFFNLHQFGKRQSKGYGQFTLESLNGQSQPTTINEFKDSLRNKYRHYYFKVFQAHLNPIEIIEKDNRRLKSGINRPYDKAKVFKFMVERDEPIRWEKRIIKQAIYDQQHFDYTLSGNTSPIDYNGIEQIGRNSTHEYTSDWNDNPDETYNYRFVRALLGLAEHYEFMTNTRNVKYVVKIKSRDNLIERFKSPLSFKVFENHIFIAPEKIPDAMFNAEFFFSLKTKGSNNNFEVNNLLEDIGFDGYHFIRTPRNVDFILNNFLRTYLPSQPFNYSLNN